MANEHPSRDDLIAYLIELVQDGEEMGYFSFRCGLRDPGWRGRWKSENAEWYELVNRGRRLLEACDVRLAGPDDRPPTPVKRDKGKPCKVCGSHGRRHKKGCSKSKTC